MAGWSLLSFYQFHGVTGNHDFLIGRNHHHFHLGIIGREHLLHATAMVAFLIHLDAEVFQIGARIPANAFLILTHAGGKDDDVNAIHGGGIGTNILLDTIVVHLQCQVSTLVALTVGILYLTHVRTQARNTGHTTLLIQRSEEHTSELQSRQYLVCRLLLEKKKMLSPSQLISE